MLSIPISPLGTRPSALQVEFLPKFCTWIADGRVHKLRWTVETHSQCGLGTTESLPTNAARMKRPHLPDVPFTSSDAARLGIGDAVIRRLVRDGVLVRVRPDLYWLAEARGALPADRRHVEIARAAIQQFDGEYVLARESAAMAHGLPTPRRLPDGPAKVSLYTVDSRNSTIRPGLHVAVSPLFPGDIVIVDGLRVTSVPRTAIDLARGLALPSALIALDGALRAGASHESLSEVALRMKQWRGTKTLRTSIPYSSGLAESALESAARGSCIAAGLPAPELQVEINGASGRTYRVDMVWMAQRLILEPDGWGKYGRSEHEQRQAFRAEKLREDDLRAAGFRVLRVTWEGLAEVTSMVARHLRGG